MTDRITVLTVVIFLGVIVLASIASAVALLLFDKTLPDMIVALGSGALGGLAGILAKTSTEPVPDI